MKIRIEEIISLIIVIPYIVFITLLMSSYIQIKMAWDLIKYKQIEVSGK